jgi:hypothetical protein
MHGQKKRRDIDVAQRVAQAFLVRSFDLAKKTHGEMHLFRGQPTHSFDPRIQLDEDFLAAFRKLESNEKPLRHRYVFLSNFA